MIPQNPEHVEAHQLDVDKKRKEFFSKQSPDVQAKILAVEKIVKELESLNIPFSLHVNPFGWEFDNESNHDFWWFGKFHKGEVGSKEARESFKNATDSYFASVGSLANRNILNSFAAVTLYDKKTMEPKFLWAKGGLHSLERKKL